MIEPFPESSLNDEAGKMFMDDYDEYFWRAKLMTSIHAWRVTKISEPDVDMKISSPIKKKEDSFWQLQENYKEEEPL